MRTERLAASLQGLAGEVSDELNRLLNGTSDAVRIRASHGYAVAALVSAMAARNAPVDIKYRDSVDAIVSLARGECDLAGFHLPIGEFRGTCAAPYRPFLDDERHMLIHLSRRKQGLFLKQGNPKGIVGLTDLARGDIRFVNRQPGSGTRILLDLALRKVGVDPDRINGYASTELTHSAIAAFVASGMADVGFGVETAASQFGLDFVPVVNEDYYFACERARLDDAPLATLLDVLRDPAFKANVDRLAGYDSVECGKTVEVASGLAGSNVREYPH
jgi:molybdate-binding protein